MIKTFICNGTSWNQITAPINTAGGAGGMGWDPNLIDWTQIQTIPYDLTWTGGANGGAGGSGVAGCLGTGGISTIFNTWPDTDESVPLSKPKGVRPDVLMGFFSQYVHALLFVTDESTYVIPFMERLGLIWIQHQISKWTAYDKTEFCAFIDNADATLFAGRSLDRKEIHKRMAEAKDE